MWTQLFDKTITNCPQKRSDKQDHRGTKNIDMDSWIMDVTDTFSFPKPSYRIIHKGQA